MYIITDTSHICYRGGNTLHAQSPRHVHHSPERTSLRRSRGIDIHRSEPICMRLCIRVGMRVRLFFHESGTLMDDGLPGGGHRDVGGIGDARTHIVIRFLASQMPSCAMPCLCTK